MTQAGGALSNCLGSASRSESADLVLSATTSAASFDFLGRLNENGSHVG
jgi:hypothetical protein